MKERVDSVPQGRLDMHRPIRLGIDVDLTVLKSDEAWWEWLVHMSIAPKDVDTTIPLKEMKHVAMTNKNLIPYNLSQYFDETLNHNVDHMDFWRNEGVYDTILPREDAKEVLRRLSDDFKLVFITHSKGNAGRSKYNNIARMLGHRNFSYIITKEKHLVNVDYMIDDRVDILNKCVENGIKAIKINTRYTQDAYPLEDIITLPDNGKEDDWYFIERIVKGEDMMGKESDVE